MVIGKILEGIDAAIAYVPHSNFRARRLGVDKFTKIVKLQAETGVGGIVNQKKKLQPARALLQRNPVLDLDPVMLLEHNYVFAIHLGNFFAMLRLNRDDHAYRNCRRSALQRQPHRNQPNYYCQDQKYERLVDLSLHKSLLLKLYSCFKNRFVSGHDFGLRFAAQLAVGCATDERRFN